MAAIPNEALILCPSFHQDKRLLREVQEPLM